MTPRPSPEAVEAAMKFAKDIPLTQSDAWALCSHKLDEPYSCANTILAAEVERLRGELHTARKTCDKCGAVMTYYDGWHCPEGRGATDAQSPPPPRPPD